MLRRSPTLATTKSYSYDAYGHRISMTNAPTGGTASTSTYAYDVHGSVSLLLGDTGTATASYGYRAYGGADDELTAGDFDPSDRSEATGLLDNPLNAFRYSGRRLDTGSGSIDMGARRFGPDTARFLQRDLYNGATADLGLALDPLTQNRYALASGNPISFVEWDGHRVLADGGGGGVVIDDPDPEPSESPTEDAPDLQGPYYREHGVDPVTTTFDFPRRPGYGTLEIDLFISEGETPEVPGILPKFRGDSRQFDAQAAPYESRAYIRFNFETGEGFVQVNPTCEPSGGCTDPLPLNTGGDSNVVNIAQTENGAIHVQYDLQNSRATWAPSINGNISIFPDPASGSFGIVAVRDGYPAFESYQYVDGQVRELLLVGETVSGPGRLFPPRDASDYYFP